MATGKLYVITDDPQEVSAPDLDEDDFFQVMGYDIADYVKTDDSYESSADAVINRLARYGARTGSDGHVLTYDGTPAGWFIISPDVRRAYFNDKFKELVQTMGHTTLDDFTDDVKAAGLMNLIDNRYGDIVYSNDWGRSTFDGMMRLADSGTVYYISNILILH